MLLVLSKMVEVERSVVNPVYPGRGKEVMGREGKGRPTDRRYASPLDGDLVLM